MGASGSTWGPWKVWQCGQNLGFLPQSSQQNPPRTKRLLERQKLAQWGSPGWTGSCLLGPHCDLACFRASYRILS